MDRQFLELLPWYANGTLADADRARLDDVLKRDARAGTELQWLQQLQQRVQADAPEVSNEIGLERTMRRIHADAAAEQTAIERATAAQAAAPKAARAAPRTSGLTERIRGWFEGMRLSPAFAMAALVIVVQAGFIFKLAGSDDSEYTQIRSLPGATAASGQLFRVAFKPEASETDIRMLLVGVQGNIESGPGQLGDYYVRVPADAVLDAGTKLKAAPIVDAVLTVDAVPPRGH